MKVKDINIKELIGELEENAFFGKGSDRIYIFNNSNIVEVKGYIYEPSYESFSATHSIKINEEILFAQNAKSVAPYQNEIYVYGKFKTTEQAIKYIEDCFGEQEVTLQYDKPNIEIKNNLNEDEFDDELEV